MAEKLPVLIAALTAETARELHEASRDGADVWVPLEREPTADGPHILEVYTADADAPIRLLAEPLGMRNEHGTALRLHPRKKPKPGPIDTTTRPTLGGGRFELLSLLGEGSMGAVYRARHTGLKNIVAVKVLHEAFQQDAEFCSRFYGEALAMSRLDHVNLISIHDFGQEPDGLLYIAMSYVEGATLRDMQKRERKVVDIPRIVALMLQVGAGLGHAHARGLIHRDVKPDNMMIVTREDDDGQRVETVKLLDFGFAVPPKVSGEVKQRLAGTPVYMSPEQCLGEELDARTDIYACGVMMYELATGFIPFFANDSATLCQMHVNDPAPLVAARRPDIDPRFERIVQRALAKDREERQPNMQALRAELKDLLLPVPESKPAPRPPSLAPPPMRVTAPSPPSPPVEPVPPSRPTVPRDDDWLERGTSYEIHHQKASVANALADKLAKDASSWLGELSRERNSRAFVRRAEELADAVRHLASRGDARVLARISAVVGGLAEAGDRDEMGRNALAAVARLFAHPDILTPIAAGFLLREAKDPQRDTAGELLGRAGVSGAVALYAARAKLAGDPRFLSTPAARVTFVTTMKSLGASARPVLRAALERIYEQLAAGRQQLGSTELTEDVLLSVPKGEDDQAAALVVKFAGASVASIARAAARALPRVAGFRARLVLLRLVQHEDDSVCLAAVVGLQEIEAVDLEVVTCIAAQVAAGRVRTQQMRAVFAAALTAATGSARAEAAAVIARLPT